MFLLRRSVGLSSYFDKLYLFPAKLTVGLLTMVGSRLERADKLLANEPTQPRVHP